MTREKGPKKGPAEDRRGLTNGNGIPRPAGLTNGLGRTTGTGRTNGLTNGLTNGVRGRTNGLTNGLASRASGLTNGLVNGTGHTNGMTNGVRGRTNGLTNGTGRTNGTGVINGLINGSIRRGLRHNRYGVITQKDLRLGISIVVLFLLLLGPFYLLMSSPPPASPTQIAVDGALGDWSGIAFLNDTVSSPNADVELRSYSAFLENQYYSFAIRVAGIPLGDPTGVDGFYIFIDKDDNGATGYRAREIGADYMIGIRGGNNAVSSSALYGFRTTAQTTDWAGWESLDSVRAAVSATALEAQLQPGEVDFSTRYSFLVAASDYEGNETMGSVHFDLSRRALQVQQVPTADSVTTSNQPIGDLTFTAFGAPVDVTRVRVTTTHSSATLPDVPAFTVTPATPVTRSLTVVYTPAEVNDYVAAHVDPTRVETIGNVPVTVDGPDLVAYLLRFGGTPPTDHRAEGFFGDWTPSALAPDADVARDANVDISRYAANHTVTVSPSTSTAFAYADVSGRIFGGSGVVERIEKATGGGGGGQGSPGPAVTRVGEDIFRVFIDVDTARPSDGTMALGVRADYRIDITGIYGRIASKTAYQWSGTAWGVSSRTVNAANDLTRMEASLDLTGVATGTMAMAIEATDWRLLSDVSGVYNFLDRPDGGTRGAPGMDPLDGSGAASVTAFPLSGAPLVDGDCSDGVYAGAGVFSNGNLSGKAGTSGSDVYICIDATIDTTSSGTDVGYIYFDRNHDGGTAPQTGDRRFYVFSGSTVLISNKGDGAGWVACGTDCASNAAEGKFTGGHEVYEFRIAFTDVWGTSSPNPGQTAGFAVIGFDTTGSNTYTWGSNSPPDDLKPNTWGHIVAPEFHDILVPVTVVGVIYFVARRRRRNADS